VSAELRSVRFRREREREWRELETLVVRVEKAGLSALRPAEIARLPGLHRAALSSLSVARATSLDRNALDYLAALAARSHAALYAGRVRRLAFLLRLLTAEFPRAVRAAAGPILLSAAALVAGTVVGAVLTTADPESYGLFVDPELAGDRGPQATTESLRASLYDEGDGSEFAFSAMLFAHNAQVAIVCFVVGFLGALPSLLVMFQNGLMLGAFAALFAGRGLGVELWAWMLPHGVTELTAVVLAGGAGVLVGRALLFPGKRRLRDALAAAGDPAGRIVLGAAAMLLVAGLFEGVFRQRVQDVAVRYAVASGFAALWTAYFAYAGRRSGEEAS
jgi:uncharacterized membrane protein SpoIIM required for sporulation